MDFQKAFWAEGLEFLERNWTRQASTSSTDRAESDGALGLGVVGFGV